MLGLVLLMLAITASTIGQTTEFKSQLGPAVNVRSLAIPRPLGSKVETKEGPPDSITVNLNETSDWLRNFYRAALPLYRWTAETGRDCWGRRHPLTNRTETLCIDFQTEHTAKVRITESP